MRIRHSSIVLVALLAAACAGPAETSPSPSEALASASASAPPSAAPATSPLATETANDPLEGTWLSPASTCDQQNAALDAAGFTAEDLALAGWTREDCSGMIHGSQHTVRFADGRLIHFNDDDIGWDGAYRLVDDAHFEAGDAGPMYITYAFAIDGDMLTIDMQTDDYPASSEAELLADTVAQTVIYESTPFFREGSGTAFESTNYPYRMLLPVGWSALAPGTDEDYFEGPGAITARFGSAQPEPGQTVRDRVAANRASDFGTCTTDPAADVETELGGEAAVRWTATCGTVVSVATNAIHDGTGYRLLIALPDGPEAMSSATTLMEEMVGTFAFTD